MILYIIYYRIKKRYDFIFVGPEYYIKINGIVLNDKFAYKQIYTNRLITLCVCSLIKGKWLPIIRQTPNTLAHATAFVVGRPTLGRQMNSHSVACTALLCGFHRDVTGTRILYMSLSNCHKLR